MPGKDAPEPTIKYCLGTTVGMVHRFITIQNTGQLTENHWNSSGILSPGPTTLEFVREVSKFISKMGEPEQFQGRIIFMSMFNDIIWRKKDNETECIANSTLVDRVAELMMINFGKSGSSLPCHESVVPRNAQKQRR